MHVFDLMSSDYCNPHCLHTPLTPAAIITTLTATAITLCISGMVIGILKRKRMQQEVKVNNVKFELIQHWLVQLSILFV